MYSAALEKGFTASTVVNDAPLFFDAGVTGGQPWEPKNFEGTYEGPISMRSALIHSKNLVSIRILQSIGTQYAQDYITKFGFDAKLHPPYLTMALGAGSATPLQMLVGYSVFANGGFRINPYLISRIEDNHGKVLFEEKPMRANLEAERAIDARNAYVMSSMMRDVIRAGTGAAAKSLGRGDLGGKTGTTNDFLDGWFCGYNSNVVTITWLGYDQPQTLGHNETGASVALPIWIQYMATALSGMPEEPLEMPPGIIQTNGELYFQEFSSAPDSESPLSAPPNETLRKP
jgi:penicillin-binding protein 1A